MIGLWELIFILIVLFGVIFPYFKRGVKQLSDKPSVAKKKITPPTARSVDFEDAD